LDDHINHTEDAYENRQYLDSPSTVVIVFGGLTLLAALAWRLVHYEPFITGSGIPQVELAISGAIPMPWRRILWSKFVATLVSLTGGLSVGREGPCIQMGAAVGCWVGRVWHDEGWETLPRFLIGGSVAGLTAAFGAPIAGLCFAFEEIGALISIPLLMFTSIAAVSAWFVVEVLFGFGLVFPFESLPTLSIAQWWIPLCIGVVTGLIGVAYNGLLMGMMRFEDRFKRVHPFLRILLAFMVSGVLLYTYPHVLSGFGKDVPELEALTLTASAVGLLLLVKIVFSCFSFASTVSGGLLMPMLVSGGLAGAFAATLLVNAGILDSAQASCLLCLGMAGLFSATVRAPLTGTALIMEMAGAWSNAPALLVTAFIAVGVANTLRSKPIYESLKARTRARYQNRVAAGKA
jgi:H+/Cl- antiporter ClcA